MYRLNPDKFHHILCYSDFYGNDEGKPDLVEMISTLNMNKAISIVCELIAYRNKKLDFRIGNSLLSIPMEYELKRTLLGIDPKDFRKYSVARKREHIISLQMLLNLLKFIIVYGNYNTIDDTNYTVVFNDYKTIIDLQMVVAEYYNPIFANMNQDEQAYFIYANYHVNSGKCVANAIIRHYYMFEILNKSPKSFDDDIKQEWRDYVGVFATKYNYSILDYISILFYELITYYNDIKSLSYCVNWRNTERIYGNTALAEKSKRIIRDLSLNMDALKAWATEAVNNPWDFLPFYSAPFISNTNDYISVSDLTAINSFSENLFWMIRNCYDKKDDRCMAFYGRLHEKYVQDLTEDSLKSNSQLTYIPEFICKSGNKSSDVYIQQGNNLIIVECKGFSVLIDTITKGEKIEESYRKLFIKPILQADERFDEIVKVDGKFEDIKNTFIISVTMDNVNAVPKYYKEIQTEIETKKKSELTKYVYNFSIEEYERLMYLAENGADIITTLKDYFDDSELLPFTMYLAQRFTDVTDVKTKFMSQIYGELSEKIALNFEE